MQGQRPHYKTLPRLPLLILPDEGIVKIPLQHGLYTVVDIEDWPKVQGNVWSLSRPGGYAHAWIKATKERKLLHRVILPPREGLDIDHIDRDKLNNRKFNLRYATRSQNKANVFRNARTSEHVGVHWDKSRQRWMAYIKADGIVHRLGRFDSLQEAIDARVDAEREYFGEYRCTHSV